MNPNHDPDRQDSARNESRRDANPIENLADNDSRSEDFPDVESPGINPSMNPVNSDSPITDAENGGLFHGYGIKYGDSDERPVLFVFCGLLALLLIYNLLLAKVAWESDPPPALSGIAVMWMVGGLGFEMILVAGLVVFYPLRLLFRLLAAAGCASVFLVTLIVGSEYGSRGNEIESLYLPIGCLIAAIPMVLVRFGLGYSLRKPGQDSPRSFSIRDLLLITTAVAVSSAYMQYIFQVEDSNQYSTFSGDRLLLVTFIGVGAILGTLILSRTGRSRFILKATAAMSMLFLGIIWMIIVAVSIWTQEIIWIEIGAFLTISAFSIWFHASAIVYVMHHSGFRFSRKPNR